METLLTIMMGIGLSAACGFRVFVPLLVVSIASFLGFIELTDELAWIGGLPAMVVFCTATVMEVLAFYIPWLDNILDSVATPAAMVAGTIVTASVVVDMDPMLRWVLALIAGGGTAALFQAGSVALRLKSSVFTGGLGNPLLATLELAGSAVTSIMAILMPAVMFVLAFVVLFFLLRRGRKRNAG